MILKLAYIGQIKGSSSFLLSLVYYCSLMLMTLFCCFKMPHILNLMTVQYLFQFNPKHDTTATLSQLGTTKYSLPAAVNCHAKNSCHGAGVHWAFQCSLHTDGSRIDTCHHTYFYLTFIMIAKYLS